MDDTVIESIVYICREVSVFKIPPLKKNEGHRAGDWGDLSQPLWKGRLRIIETSDTQPASILLEDSSTGSLFAKTEYDPMKPPIEAVLDSSRYFVVRIEDKGKKAYIGMGFAERTDSFDFNVALQDYSKRWKARLNPPSPTEEASPHVPAGPKKDYSLKEGQTFSISIPGKGSKAESKSGVLETDLFGFGSTTTSTTTTGGGGGGGAFPLLPPPQARRSAVDLSTVIYCLWWFVGLSLYTWMNAYPSMFDTTSSVQIPRVISMGFSLCIWPTTLVLRYLRMPRYMYPSAGLTWTLLMEVAKLYGSLEETIALTRSTTDRLVLLFQHQNIYFKWLLGKQPPSAVPAFRRSP
ncbi:hypothetical protein OF83DRAFT_1243796 [Amylostereum chailletii]|nr:hypothetical protein OF83DRAFT_1243796 [Amylostereum chailletii]